MPLSVPIRGRVVLGLTLCSDLRRKRVGPFNSLLVVEDTRNKRQHLEGHGFCEV